MNWQYKSQPSTLTGKKQGTLHSFTTPARCAEPRAAEINKLVI